MVSIRLPASVVRLVSKGFAVSLALVGLAFAISARSVDANTFYGSGTAGGMDVSASAQFTLLSGGDLRIILTNTTSGGTPTQTQLLDAVFFSVLGDPTAITDFSGTGTVQRYVKSGNTGYLEDPIPDYDLDALVNDGTYQFKAPAYTYEYGIGTAGFTGLGGVFNGNLVDGDDFGIVASGTDLTLDGFPDKYFVDTSATFVLSGWNYRSVSDINDVAFAFGSAPDALISAIPEPATLAVLALGGLAMLIRRRR